MSLDLLDKTRKINRLLSNQESDKIDFNQFCGRLSDVMKVNVLLFSRRGKVLGIKTRNNIPVIEKFENLNYLDTLEKPINERFKNILSTQENCNLYTLGIEKNKDYPYYAMVSPIFMSGKRLGTIFVYGVKDEFQIDDIILFEHSITVIGLAIERSESEEAMLENNKEGNISAALSTLTPLEIKAVSAVFDELDGEVKGTIVTSKLANEIHITRSVLINALKKCSSAGIMETHSAGMKGTKIVITNELLTKDVLHYYGGTV
ncbi:MAG: GTP-sensing pleiotropic transcriptional regulator CodY [Lachnospiraceae bacterium]|nr:GTP-sensing pleiotropic transcriptional regulator CodY [Lachnospiraceae bacterium]